MKSLKFSTLKKRSPITAKKFFNELEALLIFLNSPERNKWLKFIKLSKDEKSAINKIVDIYANKKIQWEKKLKPKKPKDVIKIEVKVLKEIFVGEILKFKGKISNLESFKIAEKIIKVRYPKSVILNMVETDKLATITGINTLKDFPVDMLVFDIKSKKIIGINIIIK